MVRFPAVERRLGLGVGLDLPWGAPVGFSCDPNQGDSVTAPVVRFLTTYRDCFSHLFVSWQPKDGNALSALDYFPAFDDLRARAPRLKALALHHTLLNLGALEHYERGEIVAVTNAPIARYGLLWVNEDLGLWSLHGRPLPYPLPPYLTTEGLRAAVRNTSAVQRALAAPLLLEFPGFADGVSLIIGNLHGYDFFRHAVEDTGSPATLDVGHLLSYQWLRGKRGAALYDDLERLPTAHCFEIHLSGCAIVNDRFMDLHHGVLMAEQLELLSRLLPLCPNLRAITYEDPRFDEAGTLRPECVAGFEQLQTVSARWLRC